MPAGAILAWFRQDLRLADNASLRAAVASGRPVIPVYIHDPEGEGAWPAGAASRWWLHHSLHRLDLSLRALGSRLVFRRGPSLEALRRLARESGAIAVHWNRRYEPSAIGRDTAVKSALRAAGLEARSFPGALLREPATVRNKTGGPFQVFTPFYHHLLQAGGPADPEPVPAAVPAPRTWPGSDPLDAFQLLPAISWDGGLAETWTPGETGALRALEDFDDRRATRYNTARDIPAEPGTSRFSPHLHFGELTPRQVWQATVAWHERERTPGGVEPFLRQIVWREFAHHLLVHFPHTPGEPLRSGYAKFPWRWTSAP
ncbi:MAG: deoxyribodipyrimidine photo-lyase [Kiritimatiellia bacterium]